jgi:DNA-3-methyladenine glycosylase
MFNGQSHTVITNDFFDRDAQIVAKNLIGKVICHKVGDIWLQAMIIETEAYYMKDRASHASKGWTPKRHALFMDPGTIYMYYARGGDSLNISCQGEGNAVLCKSGVPHPINDDKMIKVMQQLNPLPKGYNRRIDKLCSGQTLLCRALHLKVDQWNQQTMDFNKLMLKDVGYKPRTIIQTQRMGIPTDRDEHLPYRFIDHHNIKYCTKNPLSQKRNQQVHYLDPAQD